MPQTIENRQTPQHVESNVIRQFRGDIQQLIAECPVAFANFPDLAKNLAAELKFVEEAAMIVTSTADITRIENQLWAQVEPANREYVRALCEYISTAIGDINSLKITSSRYRNR